MTMKCKKIFIDRKKVEKLKLKMGFATLDETMNYITENNLVEEMADFEEDTNLEEIGELLNNVDLNDKDSTNLTESSLYDIKVDALTLVVKDKLRNLHAGLEVVVGAFSSLLMDNLKFIKSEENEYFRELEKKEITPFDNCMKECMDDGFSEVISTELSILKGLSITIKGLEKRQEIINESLKNGNTDIFPLPPELEALENLMRTTLGEEKYADVKKEILDKIMEEKTKKNNPNS